MHQLFFLLLRLFRDIDPHETYRYLYITKLCSTLHVNSHWGSPFLGWDFCICDCFFYSNYRGSHIMGKQCWCFKWKINLISPSGTMYVTDGILLPDHVCLHEWSKSAVLQWSLQFSVPFRYHVCDWWDIAFWSCLSAWVKYVNWAAVVIVIFCDSHLQDWIHSWDDGFQLIGC